MRAFVCCDFDGTITLSDTVSTLLERYALPEWLEIEEAWREGRFGSRECLARQTELLRIRPGELDAYLDAVEVDGDVQGFFSDCASLGFAVSVVSDGYDWAVRRILHRVGLAGTPVVANRLVHLGADRWTVRFPHSAAGCGYGVCKCQASAGRALRVHVGDGRSDFCAAERAELVFAKGLLLESLRARGLPCVPVSGLGDVRAALPRLASLAARAAASAQLSA